MCRFIFHDDLNDVPCKSRFLTFYNDVISFELRPLNFHVFTHAYSMRPQTYFRLLLTCILNQFRNIIEYHIKSKYPEEFSTCDKVGSEKP